MATTLTRKQGRFVDAYLGEAEGNATRAAELAGYADPNGNAHRLTVNEGIRSRIGQAMGSGALSAEEVVERLSQIATFDPSAYFDKADTDAPAFNLKRLQADGLGFMVKEIMPTRNGLVVKFLSSQDALNTLAKHHGLLMERVRLSVDLDFDAMSDDQLRALASGKAL